MDITLNITKTKISDDTPCPLGTLGLSRLKRYEGEGFLIDVIFYLLR